MSGFEKENTKENKLSLSLPNVPPAPSSCHASPVIVTCTVPLCLSLIHGVFQLQEPLGVPISSHSLSHLVLSHMHICSILSRVTSTCTQALLFLIFLSIIPFSFPSPPCPGLEKPFSISDL